ncbi:MAG: DNA polymerase Y family protein [Actinomycetota bacterium]
MSGLGGVRTLVAWCPHWPLVAAGVDPSVPAVVVHANRVVDVTPAAHDEGVVPGLRRRESQSRCPGLEVLDHDPSRDARWFEPVVAAVGELTPWVEVTHPGRCAVPTRGPSRYFGGDEALAERVAEAVDTTLAERVGGDGLDPRLAVRIGVADGPFAAALAARGIREARRHVVAPGESAAFLAPMSVDALDDVLGGGSVGDRSSDERRRGDRLVDLLRRLGLTRLGAVAGLPAADLSDRFGVDGLVAHRLASGLDPRGPDVRPVPPDLVVTAELDPPIERVEGAAFLSRGLADELDERLGDLGLACTRVVIEAETEHGEVLARTWRHEGTLGPREIADRIRWQLDGWLLAGPGHRPTGGLVRLTLRPDEVVADRGRQLGFWGGESAADVRITRAAARLQGLLGPEAVLVPELRGGRGPGEQVRLIPAVGVELRTDRPVEGQGRDAPWPGRVPSPSPTTVVDGYEPIEVLDGSGQSVRISARGLLEGEPARVVLDGIDAGVTGWAGPWPVEERWWDPASARRRARLQLLLDDGRAVLAARERHRWLVEARYD